MKSSTPVSLRVLQEAADEILINSELADVSIEATNFDYFFDFANWMIRVPRPVSNRTIRQVTDCCQRVLGLSALRYFLEINADPRDIIWLSEKHANDLRYYLMSLPDGKCVVFDQVLHELQV